MPASLETITAAGFGRLVQHIRSGPFAIVSAYQDSQKLRPEGLQYNKEQDVQLRDLLRTYGVGFIKIDGAWLNQELNKYLSEDSVLVPGISYNDAQALASLFDQEGFVWGNDGQYGVYETSSGKTYISGRVDEDFRQLSDEQDPGFGYSEYKGRRWQLDPEQPERADRLRQELEQGKQQYPAEQLPRVASRLKTSQVEGKWKKEFATGLKLAEAPGHFLFGYVSQPKFLPAHGVWREQHVGVPNGDLLSVYLPLKPVN